VAPCPLTHDPGRVALEGMKAKQQEVGNVYRLDHGRLLGPVGPAEDGTASGTLLQFSIRSEPL
jgi:hypothetical protein